MQFWLLVACIYFIQVYISSVIVSEISNEDESSVFKTSFRNACYALGSISYSSLIVAIIYTLRAMVNDAATRNRSRDERPNLFSRILTSIALALLNALGDIAQMANAIALPYLSINGTSYQDSVIKSYQTLTHSEFENVASLMGIDFLIFTMTLLHCGLSVCFNYHFLIDYLGISPSSKGSVSISISVLFSGVAEILFNLLAFSVIGLIFTIILLPNETKKYEPSFFELLSKKKNDLQGAGDSTATVTQ
ncbi:hypothetical protein GINT2_000878 [Glugoides intestinalis]